MRHKECRKKFVLRPELGGFAQSHYRDLIKRDNNSIFDFLDLSIPPNLCADCSQMIVPFVELIRDVEDNVRPWRVFGNRRRRTSAR